MMIIFDLERINLAKIITYFSPPMPAVGVQSSDNNLGL